MSILKNILKGLLTINDTKPKKTLTEHELLEAIDALPNIKINPELSEPTTDWYTDTTWVEVKKPLCWAEFKYIGKPGEGNLPEVDNDKDTIHFTIPLGFDWGRSVKFWFVSFPLNCTVDKIKDFYTVVNPIEA